MNKVKTKTLSIVKSVVHSISTTKHGIILCYETYTDGKLTKQYFKPEKDFHNAYNVCNMQFEYYGDNIDVKSIKKSYLERDYESFPKQIFITDLESFEKLNQLYCLWFGMDDNVYKLTNKNPLPTPIHVELWESDFDIVKCKEALEKIKSVSNIRIERNIVQNHDISGKHSLYFYYDPTQNMLNNLTKGSSCNKSKLIAKHLKLDRFTASSNKYY